MQSNGECVVTILISSYTVSLPGLRKASGPATQPRFFVLTQHEQLQSYSIDSDREDANSPALPTDEVRRCAVGCILYLVGAVVRKKIPSCCQRKMVSRGRRAISVATTTGGGIGANSAATACMRGMPKSSAVRTA